MKIASFFLSIFVLILFSSPSFASKARIESLGGEDVASYYFNDSRNLLLNPAYLNINKDFIIFEWGKDVEGPSASDATPKPEGGFFKSVGYFIYGLYLGHEEGHEGRNDVGISSPPNFLYQDNPLEFFIAGDAGVEWGASIKFSQNKDEETIKKKQSSLKLNVGALLGPLEGKLTIDLFDKSTGGSSALEEYKSDLGYVLGVNYYFNDFTAYGKFSKTGYEYRRASDGTKDIDKNTYTWTIGAGQALQLNEKAKMFIDLQHMTNTSSTNRNLATSGEKTRIKSWKLPITLGLEASVKEWLILRGHLSQNILSKESNESGKEKTTRKTTNVAAGATLDLGKLKLDGLVGTTDSSGNSNKTGVLSISNLLTKASMTYWF